MLVFVFIVVRFAFFYTVVSPLALTKMPLCDKITGMIQYALLGYPLGHSLSPALHKTLFALTDCEGRYQLMEYASVIDALPTLKTLHGFNITIPHKEAIFPFLSEIDPLARRYGAVNTVKVEGEKLHGYNTDGYGFTQSLRLGGLKLGGRVLLAGAGGTAHMIVCEAASCGAQITVGVRNLHSASACEFAAFLAARKIDAEMLPIEKLHGSFDLIVNATPCGMFPHEKECPLPQKLVGQSGGVFDVIYRPKKTQLLGFAEKEGIPAMNGLAMLVLQGMRAQEIWRNITFTPDIFAKALAATQKALGESL